MKVALGSLRWKLLALGAAAGLWGSLLHESALLLPGSERWELLRALLSGGALGLGIGVLLAPADALLHHYLRRALRSALAGALLGGLLGVLGTAAQVALQDADAAIGAQWPWATPIRLEAAGLVLTLGLVGAGSALAANLFPSRRHALRQVLLGGIVGMALAALLVPLLGAAAFDPWAVLSALAVWSGLLALVLHGWARRRARRWLRLVTGPGEDSIFPLQGRQVTLGKHERNDIPLVDFQEIFPFHCELRWAADHYEIVDNEQGGVVLVNFRQVQEHALRPGDLVKIGSALLQYGEAS